MRCLLPVIIAVSALLLSTVAPSARSAEVSGIYRSEITTSSRRVALDEFLHGVEIILRQEGDRITGFDSKNRLSIVGIRQGSRIEFHTVSGNEILGHWEANDDATRLRGKWVTHGAGGASGVWNLIRIE